MTTWTVIDTWTGIYETPWEIPTTPTGEELSCGGLAPTDIALPEDILLELNLKIHQLEVDYHRSQLASHGVYLSSEGEFSTSNPNKHTTGWLLKTINQELSPRSLVSENSEIGKQIEKLTNAYATRWGHESGAVADG